MRGIGMSLKHFAYWLIGGLISFAVSHSVHNYLILAGYVTLSGVVYVLDCIRDPMRDCWACGGKGNHRSRLFGYAHGECRACGRSGRQRRLGAILIGRDPN